MNTIDQDIYYSVFKTPDDHLVWEKHIEYITKSPDYSLELKLRYIDCITFLSEELGRKFLKTAEDGHPLAIKIYNHAGWQTENLIEFAETLKLLKFEDSNYLKLKQKLHSASKAKIEGLEFVELSKWFLKSGFKVYFCDEIQDGKSCDIKLTDRKTGDNLFIEVTTLDYSANHHLIRDNFHFFVNEFMFQPPHVFYTGKQKRLFSFEESCDLRTLIQEAKEKVITTNKEVKILHEIVDILLIPNSSISDIENSCKKNGTEKNTVSGMPLNFNETPRIFSSNKIKRKARQIPLDSNGIIYINVKHAYFWHIDIDETVSLFQTQMSLFPNLLGVVLYSYVIDPGEEVEINNDSCYYKVKMISKVLRRDLLFVLNTNRQVLASDETIEKIYRAFR